MAERIIDFYLWNTSGVSPDVAAETRGCPALLGGVRSGGGGCPRLPRGLRTLRGAGEERNPPLSRPLVGCAAPWERVTTHETTGKGYPPATKRSSGLGGGAKAPPRVTARPTGGRRERDSFPTHGPVVEVGSQTFCPLPVRLITVVLLPQL